MAVITGTNWNAYDASTMTAKEIYGRTLAALAENNDRIVGVTADLEKTTAIKFFADKFPERFYNVGIAEQNMMGIAAGLAKAGFIPFASTMAIFACMRAGEQVRTDIAYQNLPVKIIATHAGISFGRHHPPLHRGLRHYEGHTQHDGDLPRGRHRNQQSCSGLRRPPRPRICAHRPRL